MLRRGVSPSSSSSSDDVQPRAKRFKTNWDVKRECLLLECQAIVPIDEVLPDKRAYEIPDSEAETESDDDVQQNIQRTTALENTLAPILADKQAIAEYELLQVTEQRISLPIHGKDQSVKENCGRSSIYVDAFNLALETVLQDERQLFDDAEIDVFKQWNSLDFEAQYLYVRLFLRKTSAWHRCHRIGYHSDISDIFRACKALQQTRSLAASSSSFDVDLGSLPLHENKLLGPLFNFADASESEINTLEEASALLSLEELRLLAREVKVNGKNKKELLTAFLRMSQYQSGLWLGSKRVDDKENRITMTSCDSTKDDEHSLNMNRNAHFIGKILTITGPCIRLSLAVLRLFERVHLVFYRSTEWSEKSLRTIILAKISRRNYPHYVVSRSANIFPSRSMLLEFEAAIKIQLRVDNILESNGSPKQDGLNEVLNIFEAVYPRWKILLEQEQRKEDRVYESGEGAYLRRFSPAWIYTRIIHKATYVLGRFKMHDREHKTLEDLLYQRLFHSSRRGNWYQRKALLEEHYMASIKSTAPGACTQDMATLKRKWLRTSLKTCEEGLQDRDCHIIYHYNLQKRIQKLERCLKLPKREQHDFGHVMLIKPRERYVEGVRIQMIVSPTVTKVEDQRAGTKTVWVDDREGGGQCSVEEMCLSWYRSQSWKGYHSEGGIIRTIFAYLFCDILLIYVPNVFQTPYQTCPLDLHTDAFYPSRASEINHRLVEIANGEAQRLIHEVNIRERERRTCIVGLNWDFELQDLLEIVSCFEGPALATICKVMAQEYGQRGGGMPDLLLWNAERKDIMFSEVKSENDRLSDTQRLWIHVLTAAGITVELCNAVAREVRMKRSGSV